MTVDTPLLYCIVLRCVLLSLWRVNLVTILANVLVCAQQDGRSDAANANKYIVYLIEDSVRPLTLVMCVFLYLCMLQTVRTVKKKK